MYQFLISLLNPLSLLLIFLALVLLALWVRRKESCVWLLVLTIPFVLLWAFCTPVVANFLARNWETQPPLLEMPGEAEAIVILSGGAHSYKEASPNTSLSEFTIRRCLFGAELYKQRPLPVLVTGGTVNENLPGPSYAQRMKALLNLFGIPEEEMLLEGKSSDTFENAALSGELLKQRGIATIVLVTDANHLARAVPIFERQGFTVIPAGSHYLSHELDFIPSDFFPQPRGAEVSSVVFHEWVGTFWFWLRGR